jgi:steroid delta-isomerase-like uncharacterized protein
MSTTEENKALIQRFVEEAFNRGNLDIADEVYASSFASHDPTTAEGPSSPEDVKQFVNLYRRAFPDIHTTVEDLIAEGNKVTYRWTARGTHQGEIMGVAPTGNQVTITGITIEQIAEGKIVEEWNNWDVLGVLQQLGAVAPPE